MARRASGPCAGVVVSSRPQPTAPQALIAGSCGLAGDRRVGAAASRQPKCVPEQYAYIEHLLDDGRDWTVPGDYSVVDPYLLVFYQRGGRVGLDMKASYPAWCRLTQ